MVENQPKSMLKTVYPEKHVILADFVSLAFLVSEKVKSNNVLIKSEDMVT